MGISSIVNACSHLQNACKARLGLTSIPNNKYNLGLALAMQRAGLVSSVTRWGPTPPPPEAILAVETEPVTSANVASRRLWLGLKYWDNKPVMSRIEVISKPSRPIVIKTKAVERLASGWDQEYIKGLTLGELLFLSTASGVMEAREALDKKVGGVVLCRVS